MFQNNYSPLTLISSHSLNLILSFNNESKSWVEDGFDTGTNRLVIVMFVWIRLVSHYLYLLVSNQLDK